MRPRSAPPPCKRSAHAQPGNDARLQKLLACAADKDFQIVAPALMILKNVPVSAKNSKHWLRLMDAADMATRRFAVERLRGVESAEVAAAFLAQLRHPDRGLRDDSLTALRGFTAGRQALVNQLLEAATSDEAWFLARALAAPGGELSGSQRQQLFKQACAYHEQDDRRAAALWFLLRESDAAATRDQIEAKAQALRKKKSYAVALSYYRLLAHDPACSEETRFELAATGIKQTDHDLSAEARAGDPSLQQFARLLQDAAFDLAGHVEKAKWLEARRPVLSRLPLRRADPPGPRLRPANAGAGRRAVAEIGDRQAGEAQAQERSAGLSQVYCSTAPLRSTRRAPVPWCSSSPRRGASRAAG